MSVVAPSGESCHEEKKAIFSIYLPFFSGETRFVCPDISWMMALGVRRHQTRAMGLFSFFFLLLFLHLMSCPTFGEEKLKERRRRNRNSSWEEKGGKIGNASWPKVTFAVPIFSTLKKTRKLTDLFFLIPFSVSPP